MTRSHDKNHEIRKLAAEAKDLLKASETSRFYKVFGFERATLCRCQHVIAVEHGYQNWASMMKALEEPQEQEPLCKS